MSSDFWSEFERDARARRVAGLSGPDASLLPEVTGEVLSPSVSGCVPGPGLVSNRISPHAPVLARVSICEGGLDLKRNAISPRLAPSTSRGSVCGFSVASRGRLVRRLMRLDWPGLISSKHAERVFGLFLTLTYPDVFPGDWQRWKRDLDVIGERLCRDWVGFACVWKMELKVRKSGINAGKIAPHFHLLCWLPAGVSLGDFRQYIALAWYKVVGSGDEKHLRAGTQSKRCYGSPAKLMAYCSKYLAKEFPADFKTGRVWGEVGDFPRGDEVTITIDYVEFLRRLRRWGRGSRYLSAATMARSGLVVFGSFDGAIQLLRGLGRDSPALSDLERENLLHRVLFLERGEQWSTNIN